MIEYVKYLEGAKMDERDLLKTKLGTGSINIFGLPMCGKDTVGEKLAAYFDGRLLSSGAIIRQYEAENQQALTADGSLAPTDLFYEIVLPYFDKAELKNSPLILSSVGRWSGEEKEILRKTIESGHPTRAVVYLKLAKAEVIRRFILNLVGAGREKRADDASLKVFLRRLNEFNQKTLPVLEYYREKGLLIEIDASGSREEVFEKTLMELKKKLK